MFSLHPQLAADNFEVGQLSLSKVLLMNNASLPWVILVPQQQGIREWYELKTEDQLQLHYESMQIGEALMREFNGDKLNTGALGNLVPQLHVHHIMRFKSDAAWPAPGWGNIDAEPYTNETAKKQINRIRALI